MAAGPGAASGSWRQLCGHERGLAAASGSPRGQAAPGPAVRAAWGPAGSGAASAPRTLPSTANKQLLSRGRRGEAAYLLAHFSLRPAKSLPHLFFFPRAGSRKAFCTAALCLAGESRSLRRPLRSRYSRAAAPPCPPALCSLCSVALEVRSEIARSRSAAGARPRVGILLRRAPPSCSKQLRLCVLQESHCRCRETPACPTCSGFPVCTDGAGQMEAEEPL